MDIDNILEKINIKYLDHFNNIISLNLYYILEKINIKSLDHFNNIISLNLIIYLDHFIKIKSLEHFNIILTFWFKPDIYFYMYIILKLICNVSQANS